MDFSPKSHLFQATRVPETNKKSTRNFKYHGATTPKTAANIFPENKLYLEKEKPQKELCKDRCKSIDS